MVSMYGHASAAMTPVILLHGARASRTMWRPQLEALARTGRTAHAVDLPGHGLRLGETFSVEASLTAIDDAIVQIGGRAVVVGLSLGGYLGIAYTARHPARVAGLVACGCSTSPDQPLTDAWRYAARLIARLPDRGAGMNQSLVDRVLPAEGAAALAEGGFALDVMVDLLSSMRAVRPLEDLPQITCPVWIVNGQWDHFRAQERLFAGACPTATLVSVRGATHLVNLARPVAFNRVLLTALEEVDRAERADVEVVGPIGTGAEPDARSVDAARGVA